MHARVRTCVEDVPRKRRRQARIQPPRALLCNHRAGSSKRAKRPFRQRLCCWHAAGAPCCCRMRPCQALTLQTDPNATRPHDLFSYSFSALHPTACIAPLHVSLRPSFRFRRTQKRARLTCSCRRVLTVSIGYVAPSATIAAAHVSPSLIPKPAYSLTAASSVDGVDGRLVRAGCKLPDAQ